MKDRILQIRKENRLTQDAFAEKLNLSKNFVWMLEKGERIPSDRTVSDICREFSINEDWLRNGTEPMKIPAAAKLSTYLGEISVGDDDLIKDLIEVYMELDPASKEALKIIADKMYEKRKEREQN